MDEKKRVSVSFRLTLFSIPGSGLTGRRASSAELRELPISTLFLNAELRGVPFDRTSCGIASTASTAQTTVEV